MTLDLSAIDLLIQKAQAKKAANNIGELEEKVIKLTMEINTLEDRIASRVEPIEQWITAKRTIEGKMLEAEGLKTYFDDPKVYDHLRETLIGRLQTSTEELEKLEALSKEDEEYANMVQADLDKARSERDELTKLIPPTEVLQATAIIKAKTPESVRVLRAQEQSEEEALVAWIKRSGLVNHTKGRKAAIFGGKAGRESAKSLFRFLEKYLDFKRLDWVESDGARASESLQQSIRNHGTQLVIVFAACSGRHAFQIRGEANSSNVPFALCPTVGKRVVLAEIAKAFNVKFELAAQAS